MTRWNPSASLSRREQYLVGRMARTGKLFAFLRWHRHELFDDSFQDQLEGMYRSSGEGKQPVAPALLAMVVLLQEYTGASDALAVELAVVDARWQMVLGGWPGGSWGRMSRRSRRAPCRRFASA